MPSITGTFKLIKSENFDEYMKDVGVNFTQRKLFAILSPTTNITANEENEWNIKTSAAMKTTEIKFKLGEEFDETTADGRVCKSVITQEGEDKLVHVQKHSNGQTLTIVREFTDNEMKMTLESPGGIVSYRFYQRQ